MVQRNVAQVHGQSNHIVIDAQSVSIEHCNAAGNGDRQTMPAVPSQITESIHAANGPPNPMHDQPAPTRDLHGELHGVLHGVLHDELHGVLHGMLHGELHGTLDSHALW